MQCVYRSMLALKLCATYLVKQDVLRSGKVEALLAALVLQYGARQVIHDLHVAAVELSRVLRCVTQQRRRLLDVTGIHQRRVTHQTLRLQTRKHTWGCADHAVKAFPHWARCEKARQTTDERCWARNDCSPYANSRLHARLRRPTMHFSLDMNVVYEFNIVRCSIYSIKLR